MFCKNCSSPADEDDIGCCDECGGETCPNCRDDSGDVHPLCYE